MTLDLLIFPLRFHWKNMGDWQLNPECWPDPQVRICICAPLTHCLLARSRTHVRTQDVFILRPSPVAVLGHSFALPPLLHQRKAMRTLQHLRAEQNVFCVQIFICLSRACLGKYSVLFQMGSGKVRLIRIVKYLHAAVALVLVVSDHADRDHWVATTAPATLRLPVRTCATQRTAAGLVSFDCLR